MKRPKPRLDEIVVVVVVLRKSNEAILELSECLDDVYLPASVSLIPLRSQVVVEGGRKRLP